MKPLRLAIVMRRFWPLVGGTENVLAHLAAELASRGCSVTVATARWRLNWPAEIRFHDLPIVRLTPPPDGRWKTWRYTRALARWLRRLQDEFDLVYVSALREEASAAVSVIGGRVPVVLRAEQAGRYGDCLWQVEAPGGRHIKNQCMRAAALIAPTPPVRRELETAGYPRSRIHHVPNGVPIPPLRTPAAKSAARAMLADAHGMLQLSDWASLALCAGRLECGRGVGRLVAAWAAVVRRWPNARLWLAGDVPDRQALVRQIETLGLSGRVVPVGVFDNMDGLLAAADLFVAPSPEGSPVAILEAMAAGLPVVVADVPANHWLMAHGQTGLLAPGEDEAALSAAIGRLLEAPDWAACLGAAARDHVAAKFSLARMVEEHLTLFDRIRTTA